MLSKESVSRAIAAIFFLATQVFFWGPSLLSKLPFMLLVILIGSWILYGIRDRAITQRKPYDSEFSVSASVYVRSLRGSEHFSKFLDGGRILLAETVGQGALTGYLDITSYGLRWRPGPVSRLWKFRDIMIPNEVIRAFTVRSKYPGLGGSLQPS